MEQKSFSINPETVGSTSPENPAIELSPDVANILIACPAPGHEHEDAMPVIDFLKTDTGKRMTADVLKVIENADELTEKGIEREDALKFAFGMIAVKDEISGELTRKEPETAPSEVTTEPEDADEPSIAQPQKKN